MNEQEDRPELIVDTRHQADVIKALDDLEVVPGSIDDTAADDLNLVLLEDLQGLYAAALHVRDRYYNEIEALRAGGPNLSILDIVLYGLRKQLADRNGSVPIVGKNGDATIGLPQSKGVELPRPVDPLALLAATGPGENVLIGVVDTPLIPHPDFSPGSVTAMEPVAPADPAGPSVWAGHSTFVAGLIRQQAPGAKIVVGAGLDATDGKSTAWRTAKAIGRFRGSGVAILNLSLGVVRRDHDVPLVIERAIERLGPDILVVAAAGNRGAHPEPPDEIWPAAMTKVVAVGASREPGSGFSLRRPWVDCTADGVDVVSTYVNGPVKGAGTFTGYASWAGTSFAAATATGAIAARMTAGKTACAALTELLNDPSAVVKKYEHTE